MTHRQSPSGPELQMNRPNLFIVGAPKAATTSLHYYLDQHPEIFMSPVKSPAYFDTDLRHPGSFTSEENYLALFEGASDEPWRGEASTWYLFSEGCARRIAEFSPDARIIISVRNPIDFMHARYFELQINGQETAESFRDALDTEAGRLEALGRHPSDSALKKLLYRPYTDYAEYIESYYEEFGQDQVWVQIFEEFVRDVPAGLRAIFDFLDVDRAFAPDLERQRSSRVRKSSLYGWIFDRLPREIGPKMRWIIPLETQRRFYNYLRELNTTPARRPSMDPMLREELTADLAPNVRRLESLLGRNIDLWEDWK